MSKRRFGKKKNRNVQAQFDWIQSFVEYGLWWLVCVYLFLMLCMLPLYFEDGYAHIGNDKYAFFLNMTVKVGILFLPLFVVYLGCLCTQYRKKQEMPEFRISVTDKFVLAYGAAVLLSYFFSEYKEAGMIADAWNGTKGWNMGARTQLLLVIIYFAVSRFWKVGKKLLVLCLPVLLGIFLLGVANRFGWYSEALPFVGPTYISTIGNINWYCSYQMLWVFALLYYIWSNEVKNKPAQVVLLVWLVAGFAAVMTNASLSGVVTLFLMFVVLYLLSVRYAAKMERFAVCVICLGLAICGVYCLRSCWGEHYNYTDVILDLVTNTFLAWAPLVLGIMLWVVLFFCRRRGVSCTKALVGIGYAGCGLLVLGVTAFVVMLIMNTRNPGCLGGLSGYSIFTFDEFWGTNRGLTWSVGWQCFAGQDVWGKIVGIGPDTMAEYLNSGRNPELLQMVQAHFGMYSLTNTHNEWLSVLVNEGLLGMITYAGIMISAIIRFLKAGKKFVPAGAFGMAVLAYTVNGMFSFQQVMGTVTLFIALGMGEACMRQEFAEKRAV